MKTINLNIVDDDEKLLKKGDALIIKDEQRGTLKLAIVCPGCGKVSFSDKNHSFNVETKTYKPSIVHDRRRGGCGWHGTITNGIISPA